MPDPLTRAQRVLSKPFADAVYRQSPYEFDIALGLLEEPITRLSETVRVRVETSLRRWPQKQTGTLSGGKAGVPTDPWTGLPFHLPPGSVIECDVLQTQAGSQGGIPLYSPRASVIGQEGWPCLLGYSYVRKKYVVLTVLDQGSRILEGFLAGDIDFTSATFNVVVARDDLELVRSLGDAQLSSQALVSVHNIALWTSDTSINTPGAYGLRGSTGTTVLFRWDASSGVFRAICLVPNNFPAVVAKADDGIDAAVGDEPGEGTITVWVRDPDTGDYVERNPLLQYSGLNLGEAITSDELRVYVADELGRYIACPKGGSRQQVHCMATLAGTLVPGVNGSIENVTLLGGNDLDPFDPGPFTATNRLGWCGVNGEVCSVVVEYDSNGDASYHIMAVVFDSGGVTRVYQVTDQTTFVRSERRNFLSKEYGSGGDLTTVFNTEVVQPVTAVTIDTDSLDYNFRSVRTITRTPNANSTKVCDVGAC